MSSSLSHFVLTLITKELTFSERTELIEKYRKFVEDAQERYNQLRVGYDAKLWELKSARENLGQLLGSANNYSLQDLPFTKFELKKITTEDEYDNFVSIDEEKFEKLKQEYNSQVSKIQKEIEDLDFKLFLKSRNEKTTRTSTVTVGFRTDRQISPEILKSLKDAIITRSGGKIAFKDSLEGTCEEPYLLLVLRASERVDFFDVDQRVLIFKPHNGGRLVVLLMKPRPNQNFDNKTFDRAGNLFIELGYQQNGNSIHASPQNDNVLDAIIKEFSAS